LIQGIQIDRDEKLHHIVATIPLENLAVRALASRHGFTVQGNTDIGVIQAVLPLNSV